MDPIVKKLSTGSVSGLTPNRRKANLWTMDDPFHWRINVSPGPNVFICSQSSACFVYMEPNLNFQL